jgi:hypothetical protein
MRHILYPALWGDYWIDEMKINYFPEDGGSRFFRNVGKYITHCTVSCHIVTEKCILYLIYYDCYVSN